MNNWFEYILFHARAQPTTPAVIYEDSILTYGMLREGIISCALRLADMNIDRNGTVAVVVKNPIRHLVLCLALYRLGIVSLSLDYQNSIGDLKVAAVLRSKDEQGSTNPSHRLIEVTDVWFDERAPASDSLPEVFWDGAQIYRQSLTSGSTGAPKLIKHRAGETAERIRSYSELNWNRALCRFGLSTNFGFGVACTALATGRTVCFAVSSNKAIRMIEVFSVDLVFASTEQMLGLTREARKLRARLKSLRTLRVSGGVPSRALLEATMVHLCENIICSYGASEAGVIAQAPASKVILDPGLVGYVVPETEVVLVDLQGKSCPAGTVGLVRCRRFPAGAADRAGERDWIDVGDVGRLDPDGRLFIFGRTTDAIGSQANAPGIPPAYEIEQLVKLEWDVADAAAIMVQGETAGGASQIWLGVVKGNDVTPEKVNALAAANNIRLPIRLFRLPAIPRSSNGKTDRPRLKAAMLASVIPKVSWN